MSEQYLKREKWDFSECPDEQIEVCHEYEFAVHSPKAREWINEFCQKYPAATFDERWKIWLEGPLPPLPILYLFPEFPSQPFLSIPEAERKRRFTNFDKSPEVMPWFLTTFSEVACKVGKEEMDSCDSEAGILESEREYGNGQRFAVFRVAWCWSNDAMVACFRRWLKDHRPEDVPIQENRGGASPLKQMKTDLKALGAWRLLKCMDWKAADDRTAQVLGDSLYSEQSAWIRAEQKAEEIIEKFFASKESE